MCLKLVKPYCNGGFANIKAAKDQVPLMFPQTKIQDLLSITCFVVNIIVGILKDGSILLP